MSKWLERLRKHEKKRHAPQDGTDKTDERQPEGVLSVLSALPRRESEILSRPHDEATAAFEERAAILEYDAGLSREDAERAALLQTSGTIH